MTKEEVIRISYAASNNNLTSSDISLLLMQYCLENGKPYQESTRFITALSKVPEFLIYCISYALEWYKRKYSINKLYSISNSMILGNGRRIILIY